MVKIPSKFHAHCQASLGLEYYYPTYGSKTFQILN